MFFIKYYKVYFTPSRCDKNFRKSTKQLFNIGLVMVIWQTIITLIHFDAQGEPIWGRTLLFLLLTSLFCTFSYFFFDNLKQFLLAVFWASILQSIICIADFFSDDVKLFLYNHFMMDANFGYLSSSRAYGLGAAESLLSINLYLGLVATSVLMLGCKRNAFFVLGFIVILFAALLVGTTGFSLGTLLLAYTIVLMFHYGGIFQQSKLVVIGIIGLLILFSYASTFFLDIEDFSNFYKLTSFQEQGFNNQTTISTLKAQAVSPICLHTLIGTSLYRGSIDGLTTMSDTGYIQSYFGNGLIFTVIFYFFLYKLMFANVRQINNKIVRLLLGFFLFSIVFMEAKEPYIHHFGNTFVFFLACFLANKSSKKNQLTYDKRYCSDL